MIVATLEPYALTSIQFLMDKIREDNDEPFIALTYDSFTALVSGSESTQQNFDTALTISKTELRTQINFDLCIYNLYKKKYVLAREYAMSCRKFLAELKKEYDSKKLRDFKFCTLNEDELYGCLLACGVVVEQQNDLMCRMSESTQQQYKGITEILKEDIYKNEIPLVNRKILELDIEGSMRIKSLPKSLLVQVAALNAIKSCLHEADICGHNDYLKKFRKDNGLPVLIDATLSLLPLIDWSAKQKLKKYFSDYLLISDDFKIDAEQIKRSTLLTVDDFKCIERERNLPEMDFVLPQIALIGDWKVPDIKCKCAACVL